MTARRIDGKAAAAQARKAVALAWVRATPLGRPVDPEVYMTYAKLPALATGA